MTSAPSAPSDLKRTPLFDAHVAAGAKMVPFGGWEMPLHYGSQIEEHKATRATCGIFDVSHMGQVEIVGQDAERVANEIVTNDLAPLRDRQALYAVMCREDGTIVDDVIVTRFNPEYFFIVVNASTYEKDVAFMERVAAEMTVQETIVIPAAESWAMMAVQGPEWTEVFNVVLGDGPWEKLPPFHSFRGTMNGVELIISTTGYTGEPGAEILCPPEDATELWDAFVGAGARPCGLAARDSLRLEKAYRLSGQDFTDAENPYEAGLGWVVKLGKGSFSGKYALSRIKERGPEKVLVGLRPEGGRIPRHGAEIRAVGEPLEVGLVTSGGHSPSLHAPIALGYVRPDLAAPGTRLEIDLGGGRSCEAKVVKTPFFPPKD